jgi:hypothetical protein
MKMADEKKQSRSGIELALRTHHAAMAEAVHTVLRNAGVPGLTVHSIRFAVANGTDHCQGSCDPNTERCVPQSSGGDVTWVCVPK